MPPPSDPASCPSIDVFAEVITNFAYTRPSVMMVKNGRPWLIRARESFENLVRNDSIGSAAASQKTI